MELAHGGVFANGHYDLVQHGASVHADVHLHDGDAGFALALDDSVLDGGGAAILGQQRGVHVDAAIFRHGKDFLAQELAKGSHYNEVGLHVPQNLYEFRGFDFFGLMDFVALAQGVFLDGGHQHFVAASFGTVGLGDYAHDFMFAALGQGHEAAHGEVRGSHKYYTHVVYLVILLHQLVFL